MKFSNQTQSKFRAAALVGALSCGCHGGAVRPAPAGPSSTEGQSAASETQTLHALTLADASSLDPALLQRVLSSPHDYFRIINQEFANAMCDAIEEELENVPTVGLHGDAHVEQLAAVNGSVGLVDFDDSAQGPAALDLLRFGVSVMLANDELIALDAKSKLLPEATSEKQVEVFLGGYQRALSPTFEIPKLPPALQAMLDKSASAYGPRFADEVFTHVERVDPEDASEEKKRLWNNYMNAVRRHRSDLPEGFFTIVEAGEPVGIGLGSARRGGRFLLRVAGPSDDPADDLVLEAKQIANASLARCVKSTKDEGARVILGMDRFAPYQDDFAVVIPRQDIPNSELQWWIQSWRSDYRDLRLGIDITTPEELEQAALWAGYLLARGHLASEATAEGRADLSRRLRRFVAQSHEQLVELTEELAHSCLLGYAQLEAGVEATPFEPGESKK